MTVDDKSNETARLATQKIMSCGTAGMDSAGGNAKTTIDFRQFLLVFVAEHLNSSPDNPVFDFVSVE